jgi:phosphonate transport system permease protein
MTATTPSVKPVNATPAALLSLVLPGLGQIWLKHVTRGILILMTIPAVAFLVNWALDNFEIGKIVVAGVMSSWLFVLVVLFWLWNIWDAYQIGNGRSANTALAVLIVAAIIYFIAWQVTDVKLDRLITRFEDARKVMTQLAHPNLIERTAAGGWQPSENFRTIFGQIVQAPAPKVLIQLGLVAAGATMPTFKAGTLIETIAIGLMATIFSTVIAVPLSFLAAHNIMSRVPGGTAVYYAMRTFFNIVRAIDTIIWGLVIIVWVGLGTFAGVLALTIHSVAALGKLYSEEIEHIDPGPVEAVTATGGNLLQAIRYAVIPQVTPPFLAYTLLRWDINMRSATIVGFVAGGGIGFFVVETIRMGGYREYAAALWAVAIVIIAVDYISAYWRAKILADQPPAEEEAKRPVYKRLKKLVYGTLLFLAFLYCWKLTKIDLRAFFQPAPTFLRLIRDFLKIDTSPAVLEQVIRQMLITIFQALLATTFGAALAIPFSFLAAKNLTGRSRLSAWLYTLTRAIFNILRSIEALLYVAIFVFWVGIGPFAGTLALAVTSFALLGKLFSEAIENIDSGPMEAVTATGANRLQAIMFAILPQIVPPFLSYIIYQWDINVRMATIIGFAGGGGIGLMLSTFFGQLQYHKAGTVVLFIVATVAIMDLASAKIRERLV